MEHEPPVGLFLVSWPVVSTLLTELTWHGHGHGWTMFVVYREGISQGMTLPLSVFLYFCRLPPLLVGIFGSHSGFHPSRGTPSIGQHRGQGLDRPRHRSTHLHLQLLHYYQCHCQNHHCQQQYRRRKQQQQQIDSSSGTRTRGEGTRDALADHATPLAALAIGT